MDNISIEIEGLERTARHLAFQSRVMEDKFARVVKIHATNVEREAKRRVPVGETSNLKNSIKKKILRGFDGPSATVFPRTRGNLKGYHRHLIEYGTGPYKITTRKKSALTDGKNVFGKSVNHPGIQAQPFMKPAEDAVRGQYYRDLQKVVDKNATI